MNYENKLLNLILANKDITVKHMELVSSNPNIDDMNICYMCVGSSPRDFNIEITKEDYDSFSSIIIQNRKDKYDKNNED